MEMLLYVLILFAPVTNSTSFSESSSQRELYAVEDQFLSDPESRKEMTKFFSRVDFLRSDVMCEHALPNFRTVLNQRIEGVYEVRAKSFYSACKEYLEVEEKWKKDGGPALLGEFRRQARAILIFAEKDCPDGISSSCKKLLSSVEFHGGILRNLDRFVKFSHTLAEEAENNPELLRVASEMFGKYAVGSFSDLPRDVEQKVRNLLTAVEVADRFDTILRERARSLRDALFPFAQFYVYEEVK